MKTYIGYKFLGPNLSSQYDPSLFKGGADLRDVDLHGANLCGANLCGARNINYITNLNKANWDKHTKIEKEFEHLLNKNRFLVDIS